MTHILDWKRAEDPRDVVHLAVQALAEGHLVALPADSQYEIAASGLQVRAVESLLKIPELASDRTAAISLRSFHEAQDYSPLLSPIARRLIERAWPGPLELLVDGGHPDSLMRRLPAAWQEILLDSSKRFSLRIPAHEAIDHVMQLTSGPLVLVPYPSDGGQTPPSQSSQIALAIDDGRFANPVQPTCVEVVGNHCRIVRPGAMDLDQLRRLTQFHVLLVCTGNTCRSPMAERLLRAKLNKKFGWQNRPTDSLPISVQSAGVAAMAGGRATLEAVEAMKKYGLDLSDHQSSPVTERLLMRADLVLTMTASHRQAILGRWPDLAHKTRTLGRDGFDVSDPFGGCVDTYQVCASQLDALLEPWLQDLKEEQFAIWDA